MKPNLQTNIYNLYLIKLSKWFMLTMPIVALFYADNGLSDYDIFLLQAVYSVSVAILEIPSGYMADIIGRKNSLVIGSILGTSGFVVYSLSTGFYGFMIAEIILGLGGSFISGSDSAMLYDSLAGMKKQYRYLRIEGRITSLGNFAETSAAVCGGLLAAAVGYRSVYMAQAVVAAIAVPASLFLLEPVREKVIKKPGVAHILDVCRESLLVNKKLSSTLLLSSIIGTTTLTMAWATQVYFVHMGLTEKSITPLWVGLNLTVAVIAAFAAAVVAKLGKRTAILIIVGIMPLSYILVGVFPLVPAVLVLFLFYAIRGYATPVLKDLVNHHCSSGTRATVLSIRNMIIRLGFAVLGPFIGAVSVRYSLSFALQTCGIVLFAFTLPATLFLFGMLRKELQEKG